MGLSKGMGGSRSISFDERPDKNLQPRGHTVSLAIHELTA
jgi:hypothetical protein